jgi:hypothetical protein
VSAGTASALATLATLAIGAAAGRAAGLAAGPAPAEFTATAAMITVTDARAASVAATPSRVRNRCVGALACLPVPLIPPLRPRQ